MITAIWTLGFYVMLGIALSFKVASNGKSEKLKQAMRIIKMLRERR